MDGLKKLVGKRIYVILKSDRKYSGIIRSVEDKIVIITDKFGETVMFSISEIGSLEEQEE